MPQITQTQNENSVWNGTIGWEVGVTWKLYVSSSVDTRAAYKLVKLISNPGAGPTVQLGPLTYPELFLVPPYRPFYLKVTRVAQDGQETDLYHADNPALAVVPSEIQGFSLAHLQSQGLMPVVVVGYDPSSKLFYPLNVEPDAGGDGFVLKLNP